MGVLDFLKRVFPPGENPMQVMEPQYVRFRWVALRLPAGWRFTEADGLKFKACGPGDCVVDGFLAGTRAPLKTNAFEKQRGPLVKLMREHFLKGELAAEKTLPTGVIWLEGIETRGKDKILRIALINPKPRATDTVPPILQVTCAVPGGAESFEALRAALRAAQWS